MSDVLHAETGREIGSRPSGRLRREGKIPAVLYGLGMEPVSVAVAWPALRRALTSGGGMATPVRLEVGGSEHLTIIKALQRHPVRRDVLHVDFLAVDPNEVITVEVPLVITGLDELGASDQSTVVQLVHALEVTAKPNSLPAEVNIDVSHITESGEVKVADLRLPAGVTLSADPDTVLATTAAATTEEEAEHEGDAEGGEGAAPAEDES